MELTGKIIAVMEARGGVSARTGNSWKTQEYVLEVPGQYPKRCVFNVLVRIESISSISRMVTSLPSSLILMLANITVVGITMYVLTTLFVVSSL